MPSETVEDGARHPGFSLLLQGAVLGASQTASPVKHDLLARLVAARLASKEESTSALASQLAVDAICRTTHRQLQLQALLCFLDEIRPRHVDTVASYLDWLDVWLSRFADYEFKDIDARHLVAIGCATYDRTSERSLEMILRLKGGNRCFEAPVEKRGWFTLLEFQWIEGLAGVRLTSVGSIVGGLTLDRIFGTESIVPSWDQ